MTLPASGTISIADLINEFGDPGEPDSLGQFYRGGAMVPNISQNAGVPTSGAIKLSDFYGATAVAYDVLDGEFGDVNPIGGGASLTLTYGSNGSITLTGAVGGQLVSASWVMPTDLAPGAYHIRADVTSGAFTSGTTGSDLALTSSRSWKIQITGAGEASVTATFTLKDGLGGDTLASGSILLAVGSA